MRMNKNRFAKRMAVAAGFFFLCAASELTRAQSSPPSPAPTPRNTPPAVRPKKNAPPPDDFAGLQYTDEQKARIDQIHQDMKSRLDAVVKDEKLTAEQRDAMLAGYQRMERSQVFKVLTTQQQKEVLQRMRARRAAEQAEQNKQSSPK
jgi:Spy/CpxP family protein refolding chaperone